MLTKMHHLWDLVYRSMLLNMEILSISGMVLDYYEYGDSNCKQVAPFNGGMLVPTALDYFEGRFYVIDSAKNQINIFPISDRLF